MGDQHYSTPLDIASSTVLITGGSSGIGLGLARCFVQAGASVIITGRREDQLRASVEELKLLGNKEVFHRTNDVERADERVALYDWIVSNHPQTNVLINNAGVQQRHPFIPNEAADNNIPWDEREKEIRINICGPMHLSQLFLTHFRQLSTTSAIVNVSSGLAFTPLALVPIYSATKAAVHSFTMSLRYQLANELPSVQVYEIVPPAVQTNLGGSHAFGEPLDEYCQATFDRFKAGEQEIGYKRSEQARKALSREDSDKQFIMLNDNFKKMFQHPKQ